MKELVIGAGNTKEKKLSFTNESKEFVSPTTLDIDPNSNPDVLWDLNDHPLPFEDESFDQIHAYEVLEHIGKQGDWQFFFNEWNEYYRILKPGGYFYATCPSSTSPWAWGDPGHTRIINDCTITFLVRSEYEKQVGKSAMTDYRHVYNGNFEVVNMGDSDGNFIFVLRKI